MDMHAHPFFNQYNEIHIQYKSAFKCRSWWKFFLLFLKVSYILSGSFKYKYMDNQTIHTIFELINKSCFCVAFKAKANLVKEMHPNGEIYDFVPLNLKKEKDMEFSSSWEYRFFERQFSSVKYHSSTCTEQFYDHVNKRVYMYIYVWGTRKWMILSIHIKSVFQNVWDLHICINAIIHVYLNYIAHKC